MLAPVSLNLSPGEQLIFQGHPSWRAILGFYLKGILLAAIVGVIARLFDVSSATVFLIVLVIIGGLFVLETVSVMVQVISFKTTGKRVFRMAPIHHHFERLGWAESTVVIRFWIISVMLAMLGLATLKLR